MTIIIDYGLGNLTSILNMHRRLGLNAKISNSIKDLKDASRLILPGVGHFDKGMENLNSSGLKNILDELVLINKKPILGICLGAQLMTIQSQEGDQKGLGWINADTVRFKTEDILFKIPHMGWTDILISKNHILFNELSEEPRFYFVHSYHFQFYATDEITATSFYGYEFPCAFQKENIFGVQFHPEKSHKYGMKLLENFNSIVS